MDGPYSQYRYKIILLIKLWSVEVCQLESVVAMTAGYCQHSYSWIYKQTIKLWNVGLEAAII